MGKVISFYKGNPFSPLKGDEWVRIRRFMDASKNPPHKFTVDHHRRKVDALALYRESLANKDKPPSSNPARRGFHIVEYYRVWENCLMMPTKHELRLLKDDQLVDLMKLAFAELRLRHRDSGVPISLVYRLLGLRDQNSTRSSSGFK